MATPPDPRKLPNNPARGWVAIVSDDDPSGYVGFDCTISESHVSEAEVTEHAVEDGSDVSDNMRLKPQMLEVVVFVTNTPVISAALDASNPNQADLPTGSTPANTPGYPAINDLPVPMPAASLAQPPGAPLFTPGGLFQAAGAGIAAGLSALGLGSSPVTQFSPLQFNGVFDAIKNTYEALVALQQNASTMTVFTSTQEYDSMALVSVSMPRDTFGGAEFTLKFKRIVFVQTATVPAPKPTVPQGQPVKAKGKQTPVPYGQGFTGFRRDYIGPSTEPIPDGYGGVSGYQPPQLGPLNLPDGVGTIKDTPTAGGVLP